MLKKIVIFYFFTTHVFGLDFNQNVTASGCLNNEKISSSQNIKIMENNSVCAKKIKIEKNIEIKQNFNIKENGCLSIGNVGKKAGC